MTPQPGPNCAVSPPGSFLAGSWLRLSTSCLKACLLLHFQLEISGVAVLFPLKRVFLVSGVFLKVISPGIHQQSQIYGLDLMKMYWFWMQFVIAWNFEFGVWELAVAFSLSLDRAHFFLSDFWPCFFFTSLLHFFDSAPRFILFFAAHVFLHRGGFINHKYGLRKIAQLPK